MGLGVGATGEAITASVQMVVTMRWLIILCCVLGGCSKVGVSGLANQLVGDWAEVQLPQGCRPQQIAAEAGAGVAVLCEDGRVFH